GAVQLGLFGLVEVEESFNKLIDNFKLVPFIISVHDERQEWKSLRETIQLLNGTAGGIGIPTGGGLVYYPDQSIEAIRYPFSEYTERLKTYWSLYSGVMGLIVGYYFGKQQQ
ncbi:MAG TPA: hypothetical protein VE844_19865, partial [Gammaproteobacteria bacterium]|nr:hypothetical protein [Gammaproteobacteria bacterium]